LHVASDALQFSAGDRVCSSRALSRQVRDPDAERNGAIGRGERLATTPARAAGDARTVRRPDRHPRMTRRKPRRSPRMVLVRRANLAGSSSCRLFR